ncbi:MAG: PfkB family carbohydrate kinase [Bryobacteraceae bacterium]
MEASPHLSPPPDGWRGARILVIGDLMLDTYLRGTATRISPEAPVPVLHVKEEIDIPGGAANVAANVAALGGCAILCGVAGSDEAGQILTAACDARGIDVSSVIASSGRPTTRKTRLAGGLQQLLRVDREVDSALDENTSAELIRRAEAVDANAIVISDYAKGAVSPRLVEALRRIAQNAGIPLLADPKPAHAAWFEDVTVVTPNHAEALRMCELLGLSVDEGRYGLELAARLRANVLVTLGDRGMALFPRADSASSAVVELPARAREVYDVAGAGDTVVAALALGLAARLPLPDAAAIANKAAGFAVEKLGTATVNMAELFPAEAETGR